MRELQIESQGVAKAKQERDDWARQQAQLIDELRWELGVAQSELEKYDISLERRPHDQTVRAITHQAMPVSPPPHDFEASVSTHLPRKEIPEVSAGIGVLTAHTDRVVRELTRSAPASSRSPARTRPTRGPPAPTARRPPRTTRSPTGGCARWRRPRWRLGAECE